MNNGRRTATRGLLLSLGIALAGNALLAAAYLWGQGGATNTVTIEARGNTFRALVDGTPSAPPLDGPERFVFNSAPTSGTVIFFLTASPPTLPKPHGIDSILVTDANDGRVLLREDFDRLDPQRWAIGEGSFELEDGLLRATGLSSLNILGLKDPGWSDYDVRVTYRNALAGTIGTRIQPSGDGVYYNFELVRDFPNFFDVTAGGNRVESGYGGLIHNASDQSLRSIAAMASSFLPVTLIAFAVGLAMTTLMSRLGGIAEQRFPFAIWERVTGGLFHPLSPRERVAGGRVRADAPQLPGHPHAVIDAGELRSPSPNSGREMAKARGTGPVRLLPLALASALALAALLATLHINHRYYQKIPHTPDEVAYLYQAELFASGKLMAPVPPVKEAFYFYEPTFLYENGERWASFYPFGHSLLLTLGVPFGAEWVIPSLAGAACVLLLFEAGRRFYGPWTGLVAAALLVASPFFLMQAASFMSHNTAVLYALVSLVCILRRERPLLYGLLGGLAFGLLLNTRPLSAFALAPLYGVLLLSYLLPSRTNPDIDGLPFAGRLANVNRRRMLIHTGAFIAGGTLMLLAMLAYNAGLTGDPFTTPYAGTSGDSSTLVGFSHGHTIEAGLRNVEADFMALLLVLHGWPVWLGLAFVFLPFLLGTRHRFDYFCLACALLLMASQLLYRFSGIYEGPRYWYEALPFLLLLSARGAERAAHVSNAAASVAWRRLSANARLSTWPARFAASALLLALALYGSQAWVLGKIEGWSYTNAILLPQDMKSVRGVFNVDDRLLRLADDTTLANALVLVRPCGYFVSPHCYGTVFLENNRNFDGPVVWARYIPGRNEEIIRAFPNRTVYIATFDGEARLEPYRGQ